MIRRIIRIDQEKCNGCGACAEACHEGAIAMVDGKAKLMRDDYCDGLGDCLPACPTGAITFVEREAAAYDEQAVMEKSCGKCGKRYDPAPRPPRASPGIFSARTHLPCGTPQAQQASRRLSQWPVQIKLVRKNAPYFRRRAPSSPPTVPPTPTLPSTNVHIKGHITLVGCPVFDSVDYLES